MSENNDNIPNSTQVPNYILDKMMFCLSGSEFKVLMFFVRQTFGFIHRGKSVSYSIKQISSGIKRIDNGDYLFHGTGVSERQVNEALKTLHDKYGLIKSHGGDWANKKASKYILNIDAENASKMVDAEIASTSMRKPHRINAETASSSMRKSHYLETKGNQEGNKEVILTEHREFKDLLNSLLIKKGIDTKAYVWGIVEKRLPILLEKHGLDKLKKALINFEYDAWAIKEAYAFFTFENGLAKLLMDKPQQPSQQIKDKPLSMDWSGAKK